MLIVNGAETARQTIDTNDGWAFASMVESDGTLFILTRDMFGGDAPKLRAFDAKTLTALEAQTLPSGTLGLDPHLENAARTLGASELRILLTVSLPLAWKGIFAGLMLAFARGMGEFGATLMVAGNIPGKTQTLALAIYDAFQAGNDALATLLVLVTSGLCVTLLMAAEVLVKYKRRRRSA